MFILNISYISKKIIEVKNICFEVFYKFRISTNAIIIIIDFIGNFGKACMKLIRISKHRSKCICKFFICIIKTRSLHIIFHGFFKEFRKKLSKISSYTSNGRIKFIKLIIDDINSNSFTRFYLIFDKIINLRN